MVTEKRQKNADNFTCEFCAFVCSKKSDWDRHILRPKHQVNAKWYLTALKTPHTINRCACGKEYKYNSGLSRHQKTCEFLSNTPGKEEIFDCNDEANMNNSSGTVHTKNMDMDVDKLTGIFIDSMKQNQEFQKQMFEMVKETMNAMVTTSGTSNIITNNNKINNTTNNTQFNLNFFLNETCKDAMNIYDFMESIQIQLEDLDYTGENGYVEGVSRIFLRELNKLDVCKRPIHCTDVKREVFHVKNKDNQWGKERDLLITAIKEITRKNVVHLNEWREAYPGCMDYYHKKNNQYLRIQSEILGSADSEEDLKYYNKIISHVAKATVVNKNSITN